MLRAVIFDVDGTLVDSERDGHRVAFNLSFAEAGMPDRWDVETYGGLLAITGGRQRLEHYLLGRGRPSIEATRLAEHLHASKTRSFTAMVEAGTIPLRPGVERLVDGLAAQQVPMFVATTGSRDWVEPLLRGHFGSIFEAIVTGSEVSRLKPHPDVYHRVLELAGLTGDGVVAIEDSANGLHAAHGAGLRCVVVCNSYTGGDELSVADLVLDQFGPPARRLGGRDVPLPGGALTAETLAAVTA